MSSDFALKQIVVNASLFLILLFLSNMKKSITIKSLRVIFMQLSRTGSDLGLNMNTLTLS